MIRIEFGSLDIDQLHHERFNNPHPRVRVKMEALYLKAQEFSHEEICLLVRISKDTLIRYLKEYLDGGIEALKTVRFHSPQSDLKDHEEEIKSHFETEPPRTINHAASEIEKLTGLKRKPTQIASFLKSIGMRILKVGTIPAKADSEKQEEFKVNKLTPRLEDARSGKRHVFFVDAAHFVHQAFLGFLWCFKRLFLKAPSGRKRFNVLGALDAVTNELITVTNETYVNAPTVCELLETIARKRYSKPITLVLDNARYQKCQLVTDTAKQLNIELLYLPSYSPNLNLIERLWKWVKKECLYSKYYSTFSEFKRAINTTLNQTIHEAKDQLKSLLTLKFQTFPKVAFVPV